MTVTEHHQLAMEWASKAAAARWDHRADAAIEMMRKALDEEIKAADICYQEGAPEPTFSVLHRSAASLALDCGEFRLAEKLVARALAADPAPAIADELRDLMETVNFSRHLDVRGVVLAPDEVQLSLAGGAVAAGLAPSDVLVDRIENTARLIYRIVERRLQKPFREFGAISKDIREYYDMYVSVPRAASFAVSLKLGRPKDQTYDLEILGITGVIDEFFEYMGLLNENRDDELKNRIGDSAYFNNFVSLSKLIAPDGKDVTLVGFTRERPDHKQDKLLLTRTREAIPFPAELPPGSRKQVTVRGKLLYANALASGHVVKVVDRHGKHHTVKIPEGMMTDIVRPLWNSEAIISGYKAGRDIVLEGIQKAEGADPTALEEYYYVNVGAGEHRAWEDFRRYGFISAGGAPKYSKQLRRLHVGNAVFAYLKEHGYVGFGEVVSEAIPIRHFFIPGTLTRLSEVPLENAKVLHELDDPKRCEWAVGIRWMATRDPENAATFHRIFANENIACRLNDKRTLKFLLKELGEGHNAPPPQRLI
jgi:hypothetical protein